MKIVQINAVYAYSSTGRTTREMHEYLMREGHESYVFCSKKTYDAPNVSLIGSPIDHKLHGLLSRITDRQGFYSKGATKMLITRLEEIQPDVVVLRNLHGNYINVPILLEWLGKNNTPTIIILHDCWFFTGHCCYYVEDNCDKWKSLCMSCPAKHKYNKSIFIDNSTSNFKIKHRLLSGIGKLAVVGVSDWVTNEAKQAPIFAEARIIKRIYNWIDHSVFYPRETDAIRKKYSIKESDFVVLGVAQVWNESKGLGQFVKLAENAPDIKVVLVGNATVENKPSNLILAGVTSNVNELAEFYSTADVLVNFSNQETFGKVSAESLSCGTPIITNRMTANPELCGKNCGYVVESIDWNEVIDYIEIVKRNGKQSYEKVCYDFSRANFDREACLNDYMNLFKSL